MFVVTGGAGFIGSTLVRALNDRGITDIWVVDEPSDGDQATNLDDCRIDEFLAIGAFRELLAGPGRLPKVEAIFHQGACTDTAATDRHAVMDNNCTFSQELMRCALTAAVPFVYASSAAVYGAGSEAFTEDPTCERPINLYAQSKLAFDQHVRREIPQAQSTLVGLRYFNVYGPRESRKGKMASMVYQLYRQLKETGTVRLFTGTGGYGDGEQRRDFIHVDDVVAANLHFALGPRPRPPRQGIFNLRTGQARSFNDVVRGLIDALGEGLEVREARIEYIPFPDSLQGKYQSFTQADLTRLRQAGYRESFISLEDGIRRLVAALAAGT